MLQQKHPKGPIPTLPDITLPPGTTALPPEFNIMSVLRSFPRDTACGPSGLRIQHLIDAAEVHLPISICSSLRVVVNILTIGKAPMPISRYLAGGSLTALIKNKEDLPLDICPIAVAEAMRRLTGKCLCILSKDKAAEFFGPFQLGVACPAGAEKIIHGVRRCVQDHWNDDDFVLCKIDLTNAFNMVSHQALLEECATHFPELFPWVSWCYGQHPTLWHPMGVLSSELGVQQGDPLGPLLFSLVLHKLICMIIEDMECSQLLLNS